MKLAKLTHKSIKPYGWIIDARCAKGKAPRSGWGILIRERSKGWRIAYLVLRQKTFERLERHPDSLETFEPVKGKAMIALAPAKNPDKVKPYLLDKPIVLKKGVWHNVATISGSTEIKIVENIEVQCEYRNIEV